VFNYAVQGQARATILSGAGFALGATILAVASFLGVAAIKDRVSHIEDVMLMVSGTLLIWFAYKLHITETLNGLKRRPDHSGGRYLTAACMLNLANPKAIALLTSIYGGVLANIHLHEVIAFMVACLLLEIIFYTILFTLFSSKLVVGMSGLFLPKIAIASRIILFCMGAFFIVNSMRNLVAS
jgi:threonine/homoserine/homoserine lactone efflux protein